MMVLERSAYGRTSFAETRMTKSEQLKSFGNELRRRRETKGIDQKVLAARLGISPQHLSQIETGYSRQDRGPVKPSDKVVSAISREFDWDMVEIRRDLGQLPAEVAAPEPNDDDFLYAAGFSQLTDEYKDMVRKVINNLVASEVATKNDASNN